MKIKDTMARLQAIVDQLDYKHWSFRLLEKHNVPYLRVEFWAPSSRTGDLELQQGRPWILMSDWTEQQVVQTALMAVLAAEEHEARESFTFKSRPLFSPHHQLEVLAAATPMRPAFPLPDASIGLDLM